MSISASGLSSRNKANAALAGARHPRRGAPTQRARRPPLLLIMLAWSCCVPVAEGIERLGDAETASELQQRAISVAAVQGGLLALAVAASGEERFNLYRTYGESMGTWLQVEFVRSLLDLSMAAAAQSDEQNLRTNLRDHAKFTLWELDQNIGHLSESFDDVEQSEHLRLIQVLHSLLLQARITVGRLLADQCARPACETGY